MDQIIELMLETAALLPVNSLIGRELAESAGRLQVARRVPGGGDTKRLRDAPDITAAIDAALEGVVQDTVFVDAAAARLIRPNEG